VSQHSMLAALLHSCTTRRRPGCLTFMASHIASSSKLEGLSACLQSISSQTWASRHGRQSLGLLISWSAVSEDLAQRARALFANLVPEHIAIEQSRAHSQFEHYRQLAKFLAAQYGKAEESTLEAWGDLWIGFTDDDDVSLPGASHHIVACSCVLALTFDAIESRADRSGTQGG
jgi:hypothetical protein